MTWLRERCPRLALARDQRIAELEAERRARRRARAALLEAERVVAHRELQLARAWATSSRSYIKHREAKLRAGRARLLRAQRHARALGC